MDNKYLLMCDGFKENAKVSPKNFTRERKMGLVEAIKFVLKLPRRSLPIELNEFCGDGEMTKQAFSKCRKNIKPEAFRTIARTSALATLRESAGLEDYHGLRVFAVDGTELEIPPTAENIQYWGRHGGEKACCARVSALCHIGTKVIVESEITPFRIDERTLAERQFEYAKDFLGERDLIIFDRGYPSKKMLHMFEGSNVKYLMRVQKSFAKEIDEGREDDFDLRVHYKKDDFDVRVVRVVLENGEVENLLTNLPRSEFEPTCFKELYFMRWGIEGRYDTIKNKLLVEHFSGTSRIAIEQDFYATIFAANMLTLAKGAADQEIAQEDAAKQLKYEYQANEKLAIQKVRNKLMLLMAEDDLKARERLFDSLVADISRNRSEIRPGRHFSRSGRSRHPRKHRSKFVF
jgi:hypothetical protein